MEKKWPKFTIFQRKKFLIARIFYDNFYQVTENIKHAVFVYFHIQYVAKYGQIILWMITTSATSHNPTSAHPSKTKDQFFPTGALLGAGLHSLWPCPFFQPLHIDPKVEWSGVRLQSHFRLLILSTAFWLTFIQKQYSAVWLHPPPVSQ